MAVRLTPETFAKMSVRCWACERPLPSTGNPEEPGEYFCHGCGEFFCDDYHCKAFDGEAPFGDHEPDDHMPADDAEEDDA